MTLTDNIAAAKALIDAARAAGRRIVTAESCTGGLIAATLTEIAGSAGAIEGGFVTYSNAQKRRSLGVDEALIAGHGAVSEPVARAMATGALKHAPEADIAIAVTGIAGPGGGSAAKPVGTVWFAVARRDGEPVTRRRLFKGDRGEIRAATVAEAIALLGAAIGDGTAE